MTYNNDHPSGLTSNGETLGPMGQVRYYHIWFGYLVKTVCNHASLYLTIGHYPHNASRGAKKVCLLIPF